MSKLKGIVYVTFLVLLGLMIPQEWASATTPPPAPCDVTLTSGQNIQTQVDLGGPKVICLQGTFKQSVIIGPEDTATGPITIQGVSPGGIMDGQNGIGAPDPGTSYSAGKDAFELLPGVHNVTIRDLEIKDYKDPAAGTGTGNAVQAWGPYVPGAATSNVNIWNNNMNGFSWNGILVGNSGTGIHSNWSVIGNTVEPCWIGIELTNTINSVIEDNTVSGGGCFPTDYPPLGYVIGIMLQARNIAVEGGSGSLTMSNVSVQGNTIIALGPATYEYGIYLLGWANGGPTATLSNIKVGGSGNRLENNAIHGIVLNGLEQGTVDGVSIVDNNILNNNTGIRVVGTSTNVTAHFNNISSNITWGARNTAAAELDAELNWWGSSSGPTHSGNPSGTGDAVTDNVDYHPWLVTWPLSFYWKDYNGEDLGGYMPDIDQNQDFDKVIVSHEQDNPNITYSGQWTTYTVPGPSGGSIICSNDTATPGSATFTFNGTSIRWIEARYTNRGISEVWIDGQLMTAVDAYGPLQWQQVMYSNDSLAPGQHTIEIKITGQHNPQSSDYYLCVDAFDVDDIEHDYCAPVAEANSLWWLDKKYANIEIFSTPLEGTGYIGGDINQDGNSDILDLVQELAIMMKTNQGHTGTTVLDEQDGIDTFLEKYGLNSKLYEHTIYSADFPNWLPYFAYIEAEVERSQDVKLDLGFWHVDEAIPMGNNQWLVTWSRRGGHAVTVAGVDSQNFLLAISDPDNDAAESGGLGVIRPVPGGHLLHPNDPSVHNNEANASHDIYTVGPSPSPGGKMGLLNFPWKWNLPTGEWESVGPVIVEWPEPLEYCMTFTEIEAAVIVSPIICGNGNVDPGEECDDGNLIPGDGCSPTCKWEPDIAVNPFPSWDFGNVLVGASSTKTFTISNTAVNGNLVISSIGMTGGNAGMFSVATGGPNPCPSLTPTIAPGGNCTINAKFSPTSLGAKSTTMRISSNDPDENPVDVPLSGTGTQPDISVSPTSLNFAQVIVGGSSTKTLTISNTGGATLSILTIGISGTNANQFSKQSDTCSGQNIAPSGSCTVDVKFSPTSKGNKTATLSINSNDPDENPLNVSLKGKGAKVVVTSPNGGESLFKGSTHNITWQTSAIVGPVAKVVLKYTINGGATWTTITNNYLNLGTYPWYVPIVSSSNCKVKVILKNTAGSTLGSDVSDSTFTIQ